MKIAGFKYGKKNYFYAEAVLVVIMIIVSFVNMFHMLGIFHEVRSVPVFGENKGDYIKWVDFNVPLSVLNKAYEYDVASYGAEIELDWIELIAYSGTMTWGTFDNRAIGYIDSLAERLNNGEKIEDITNDLELYPYYIECYHAVLSGFVGEYEAVEEDPNNPGEMIIVKKYGVKAYSPVARGYHFNHYKDFGNTRSYGYKRKHLGNDIMGSIGTPIIAVEDGYVEALGWNQYGGWRVGIRSYDGKRYYYYAHLRKDHPFVKTLSEGDRVQAGDVIGYLGMTGYSKTENVNNIEIPHLHFGLQLIFDESQKDGVNQIWIDVYNIVEFLEKNRMPVYQEESGDFKASIEYNSIVTE